MTHEASAGVHASLVSSSRDLIVIALSERHANKYGDVKQVVVRVEKEEATREKERRREAKGRKNHASGLECDVIGVKLLTVSCFWLWNVFAGISCSLL